MLNYGRYFLMPFPVLYVEIEKLPPFYKDFERGWAKRVGKLSWGEGSEEREVVERFYRELLDFVDRRGASAVVQLGAPANSLASFTLMLWALVNGDEELARAHAKLAWILFRE